MEGARACAGLPPSLALWRRSFWSGPPDLLAPGSRAPLSLRVASFSGPQDLDLRTSVYPSFALASNLSRARLGVNESAWGRLWLQIPDSAPPDSVVTVTVAAVRRDGGPGSPTHAFLRLLVQARAPQDQLAAGAHSADAIRPTATPSFHPSPWGAQGSTGGGMADNPWWGTIGGLLLLLGVVSW